MKNIKQLLILSTVLLTAYQTTNTMMFLQSKPQPKMSSIQELRPNTYDSYQYLLTKFKNLISQIQMMEKYNNFGDSTKDAQEDLRNMYHNLSTSINQLMNKANKTEKTDLKARQETVNNEYQSAMKTLKNFKIRKTKKVSEDTIARS